MNCKQARPEILKLEHPEDVPEMLALHLQECAKCRRLHVRMFHVEHLAKEIPVSTSRQQNRFLSEFMQPDERQIVPIRPEPPLSSPRRKERARRKLAFAFAMASALLICVLGWSLWNFASPESIQPFSTRSVIQNRLKMDHRWNTQRTPAVRLTVISDVEKQLFKEARKFARSDALPQLQEQVRLYRELIDRELFTYAERISPRERVAVLTQIRNQLSRTESAAERLAAESSEASATLLRKIAQIARLSDGRLQKML